MSIGSLSEDIKMDLEKNGSYDRYPVRFLSVRYDEKTSDTLMQLKKQMTGVELFDIRNILPSEDGWITPQELKSNLNNLDTTKSYMVVGFSEYARFLSREDFSTLLISLLEIENSENLKRRIYIICFALYSQIHKALKSYHRLALYNPLLNEVDAEDLPHIYFIRDNLNVNNGANEVKTSSAWFGMWRNINIDPRKPIICFSKTLSHFYEKASPDNIYNIKRLETYQDILKYMYSIKNLHVFKKDPDGFCNRLINILHAGGNTIVNAILVEVNAQSIDSANIYWLWKQNDVFTRWLIQNYILMESSEDSYLFKIMLSLEELSDKEFIENIYEKIFDYNDVTMVEERKQILESIRKIEKDICFSERMESYYNKIFKDVVNRNTAISLETIDFTSDCEGLQENRTRLKEIIGAEIVPYLTCFSRYERQFAIWLYRAGLITTEQVRAFYPNFWCYIRGISKDLLSEGIAQDCNQYFDTYRKIRLSQIDEREYTVELGKWNGNEDTFYGWYSDELIQYPEVYLRKSGYKGNVYVLDGVGAEFLGYLLGLLEVRGYFIESFSYCKCHLPSITNEAKDYYPSEKWIWKYDTYDKEAVHGEIYYHVPNMEKALTIIEDIVEQIISQEENDFAITADHGATVGHKIDKRDKKYNFEKADHGGRCYLNENKEYIEPCKDYIVHDDEMERQWVIPLNQQSLYTTSPYAVHGGATPEEIFVPVIIAKKSEQRGITYYTVKAVNLKVSGLEKSVMVKISPMPKEEKVYLAAKDGTQVEMILDNNMNIWSGELKRGIEQDITVSVGEQIYEFRTEPETRMGDDLFDD